jgi:hypothetical protein
MRIIHVKTSKINKTLLSVQSMVDKWKQCDTYIYIYVHSRIFDSIITVSIVITLIDFLFFTIYTQSAMSHRINYIFFNFLSSMELIISGSNFHEESIYFFLNVLKKEPIPDAKQFSKYLQNYRHYIRT